MRVKRTYFLPVNEQCQRLILETFISRPINYAFQTTDNAFLAASLLI